MCWMSWTTDPAGNRIFLHSHKSGAEKSPRRLH